MTESRPIVIGAGIAGLTLCWELCKLGEKPILLERQNFCGGLATSISHRDYQMDIGPHYVALPKVSDITEEIFTLMGKENVIELPNDIFQKFYKTNFNGKLYSEYPPLMRVIKNSGFKFLMKSMLDFFVTKISPVNKKSKFTSSKNYLCSSYGNFLYNQWFKPYLSRKYQDNEPPLDDIIKQFPSPTFRKFLFSSGRKTNSKIKKSNSDSENESIICYFNSGMGALIKKLESEIIRLGGIIELNFKIENIKHSDSKKIITGKKDGEEIYLESNCLVYTTSPQASLHWFNDVPESFSKKSTSGVHSIMLFLFIDKPRLFDSWVVNFYDENIIFSRIAQQNFLTDTVCPKGKSLLSVEIRTTEKNPLWKLNDVKLFEKTLVDLKKSNILSDEKIDGYKIIKFRNLYSNSLSKNDDSGKKIIDFIISHKNEFVYPRVMDTGILATGSNEKSPQKIMYGAGIYMSFYKSKNLAEVIKSAL